MPNQDLPLPCPFCGESLQERGDHTGLHGAAWNWWQHDENSECIANDIKLAVGWDGPSLDIVAWNQRRWAWPNGN